MSFEHRAEPALDYFPCRYGTSRAMFRGPRRRTDGPYFCFLGGTATYGRFVPRPFPGLVEDALGVPCLNLGQPNAGPDAFLRDGGVVDLAAGARAVVVEVTGAQALSNRYYAVHPRRNDRFLKASGLMRKVFPETDFTEFHFTRHLLHALQARSEERFEMLVAELREAWIARMETLIAKLKAPVLLLWFADHAPVSGARPVAGFDDPLFVTRGMLDALRPKVLDVVEAVASPAALTPRTHGMVFNELEAAAAAECLGPVAHREAAERIVAHLSDFMALAG